MNSTATSIPPTASTTPASFAAPSGSCSTRTERITAITGTLFEPGVVTTGGITQEYLTMGRGKDFGNPFRDMTEDERTVYTATIQNMYDVFVGWVAEARDLTRRPVLAAELKRIDTVLFDPPRAGAAEQCAELASSKVSRVIGVSCNPATFVRDARILADAGFTLDRLLPVDQFLWSPHIELVAVFNR